MPFATSGGGLVTGTNIVDGSISTADFSAAAITALEPTVSSIIPRPVAVHELVGDNTLILNSNTTAALGKVEISRGGIVTKLTFYTGGVVTTPGTIKIALFSEDGQTKIFEKETASLSATNTKITEDLSSVDIPAGNYWLVVVPVSTANLRVVAWGTGTDASLSNAMVGTHSVTGKLTLVGRLTVTASTIPSTLTLSSITAETTSNSVLLTRFDV